MRKTQVLALPIFTKTLKKVSWHRLEQPINLPGVQKTQAVTNKRSDQLQGTWEIDLRPTPAAEPYLKEFVISNITDKSFSGVFYGSEFTGGQINVIWEKIYFAFTTGDKDSTYFHSGYVEDGKIYGITYSPERKFITPWTGKRK